jgi:hypothetical protein
MAALFVPFTRAHGPTSYNEEREILTWDMRAWGFVQFVLAPVTIALATLIRGGPARTRVILAILGTVLFTGLVLTLIPSETSDSIGGYRIYGTVVHGLGGLLWALLGTSLRSR